MLTGTVHRVAATRGHTEHLESRERATCGADDLRSRVIYDRRALFHSRCIDERGGDWIGFFFDSEELSWESDGPER